MWYVVQVRAGTEERIGSQCRKIIGGDILKRCFIPRYEEKKKYQGSWHTEEKILFPGYVFMVSDRLGDLYDSLQNIDGMAKLIGTGKEIVPLSEGEVYLLEKMGAGDEPVKMSTGIMENGAVIITEGPLEGMEGCIKRIDRHKRKAWLEMEMFGRRMEMEVGVEIVAKV